MLRDLETRFLKKKTKGCTLAPPSEIALAVARRLPATRRSAAPAPRPGRFNLSVLPRRSPRGRVSGVKPFLIKKLNRRVFLFAAPF